MIIEITVKIRKADGTEELRPVVIDAEIPEFDEFEGPQNFREVFHKYEQTVLEIRNKAARLATEEYLAELSKKNSRQRSKDKKDSR